MRCWFDIREDIRTSDDLDEHVDRLHLSIVSETRRGSKIEDSRSLSHESEQVIEGLDLKPG